jgi:hypothetical protein
MDFNFNIEKCKNDVYTVLGNSQLPLGVLHYLVKDIAKDVEQLYFQAVAEEQQKMMQEQQQVESDDSADGDLETEVVE